MTTLESGVAREFQIVTETWSAAEPTSYYIDVHPTRAAVEAEILNRCIGRVLDVGAAAGRLTLALQAQGFQVIAVDHSQGLVDLMRERGVLDPRNTDIFELAIDPVETIVFAAGSIGLSGDTFNLRILLTHLQRLLVEDGQLLIEVSEPCDPGTQQRLTHLEALVQLQYGDRYGEPFEWQWIGADGLIRIAEETGWTSERCLRTDLDRSLLRLRRRS